MSKFLCAVLLAASSSVASAKPPETNLPDWSKKPYITIVMSGRNTIADQRLKEALETQGCRRLLECAIVTKWTPGHRSMTSEWRALIGTVELPAILVQGAANKNGQARVTLFLRGQQLSDHLNGLDSLLHSALSEAIEQCRNPRSCPLRPRRPQPEPTEPTQPTPSIPEPAPVVIPQVITPTVPEIPEDENGFPLVLCLIPLGAGLWPVIQKFRKG